MKPSKIAKILIGSAAVAGGAYLVYRVLKEEYSFIDEQQVKIDLLPAPVLESVFAVEATYRTKLDRARFHVFCGKEKHSMDIGAFLGFAALEEFLRAFLQRLGIKAKSRITGIVDACKRLRSANGQPIISRDDYDRLCDLTKNLRNPLFHGEIYKKENVPAAVCFIADFVDRYEPALPRIAA